MTPPSSSLKRGSFYFIGLGVIQLCLAVILIICSGIILDKYLRASGAGTYALFLLFYFVTGGLCIVAGTLQRTVYITITLMLNVLGMILSTVGAAVSSVFWQMYRDKDACSTEYGQHGECICFHGDSFRMSCSDGKVSRSLLGVLTVGYILMTLTTFLAVMLSCSKACCDPTGADQGTNVAMENSVTEPTFLTLQENEDNEQALLDEVKDEVEL